MTTLSARKRGALHDSAFAYVDSRGRRRLPIHDEPHVRNALARFNQVQFEDDEARDRARRRLLRAAKKYGIVPIGFMDAQLRRRDERILPSGAVTFLLTDIQDSTGLVQRLGDAYAPVLADTRRLIRSAVRRAGGHEVDARADEFFAVFKHPPAAIEAAVAIQRAVRDHDWPAGNPVRLRAGVHSGRPTLTDFGYVGLAVHATARVSAAAHGGQILLSGAAARAIGEPVAEGHRFVELGTFRLRGLPDEETLFQVTVIDLPSRFPPPVTDPA
ncbi:MAG TPA: adenylate/guanylate cyclase domain-containing protein [Candidatus Limnocylindria bacterium]